MPTSAPGSRRDCPAHSAAGFTLLELLIVITVIALSTGLSILALRDSSGGRLEQEAARLSALLEAARIESRTSGRMITWRPTAPPPSAGASENPSALRRDFIFEPPVTPIAGTSTRTTTGASGGPINNPNTTPKSQAAARDAWPTHWLHEGVTAEIIGAPRLVLGPEPIIAAQRLRLRLGEQQLVLSTDGLGAFSVEGSR